jgi:hypothetical protein
MGITLDKKELKSMVRNWINKADKPLSPDAQQVFTRLHTEVSNMKTAAARLKWFRRFQKGVVLVTVLGAAVDATRGYAGEGRFDVDGVPGAALEASDQFLQNLVFKEDVEMYIFSPVLQSVDSIYKAYISPFPSLRRRGLRSGVDLGPNVP